MVGLAGLFVPINLSLSLGIAVDFCIFFVIKMVKNQRFC